MDFTFSDASAPTSGSKKRTIILATSILGILAAGIAALIFFSPKNTLPKAFFSAFDAQTTIANQILTDATFDYLTLGDALKQNYQKAVQVMQIAIANNQKAGKQIDRLTAATIILKKLLPQLKDSTSSQTILQLFGLIDDRNNKLTALLTEEQPFFTTMYDTYTQVLRVGKAQIPQNAEQQAKRILDDTKDVQSIQTQIDTLYAGIKKDAGMDDGGAVKTDDMLRALNTTATSTTLLPTTAETPTVVPAVEDTLPVGPVLPEGATTSAAASQSAK